MQNPIINHNWKELIKPGKLNIQNNEDKSLTTVVAEPLEKGYALTIGNSLRRILLSSIQGSAITAIQIDGVLHEFSSIKGVREDVTDIVLNVKNLAIKSTSTSPTTKAKRRIVRFVTFEPNGETFQQRGCRTGQRQHQPQNHANGREKENPRTPPKAIGRSAQNPTKEYAAKLEGVVNAQGAALSASRRQPGRQRRQHGLWRLAERLIVPRRRRPVASRRHLGVRGNKEYHENLISTSTVWEMGSNQAKRGRQSPPRCKSIG